MRNHFSQAFTVAFALLISTTAASAFAQGGMPQEISGTYTNEVAGVTITFPDGWSGFEVAQTPETTLAITSPGGLSESDPETMKTIGLLVTDKGGRDVNDPSSFTQEVSDCNEPAISSRTVAGVQGTEITVECPSTAQKFRMVAVETADNIVGVMYMTPASEFDANLAAYDSAVASLQVQGAVDSTMPETPTGDGGTTDEGQTTDDGETTSNMMLVMVGDEEIEVAVESTSTISEFELDEESKTITFMADGDGDSTVVAVGSVLEGPYTVMVDGEESTDFEETTNADGVKTISVPHASGAHEVTVTGTQVVPEFPIAVLGIVAAVIALVTVVGRTNLVKGKF